jgi:hypothetical protein
MGKRQRFSAGRKSIAGFSVEEFKTERELRAYVQYGEYTGCRTDRGSLAGAADVHVTASETSADHPPSTAHGYLRACRGRITRQMERGTDSEAR